MIRRPREGGAELRTGVLCVVTESALSTTRALRNLANDTHPVDRLLLVTDARRPLAFGRQANSKGRSLYDDLQRGERPCFQHLGLTFDQYLYLDSLRAVARMAHAGDLELELTDGSVRRLTEQDVLDSHHRKDRYLESPLLQRILTGTMSNEITQL